MSFLISLSPSPSIYRSIWFFSSFYHADHEEEEEVLPADVLICHRRQPLLVLQTRPSHPLLPVPPTTTTTLSLGSWSWMRMPCLWTAPCVGKCSPATQSTCMQPTAVANVHPVRVQLWTLCSALFARTCFSRRLSLSMPAIALSDTALLLWMGGGGMWL